MALSLFPPPIVADNCDAQSLQLSHGGQNFIVLRVVGRGQRTYRDGASVGCVG